MALHALLDSPDLRVASENTVVAAVTRWLQPRSILFNRENKLQLLFKLRLDACSDSFITALLMYKFHWVTSVLDEEQVMWLLNSRMLPSVDSAFLKMKCNIAVADRKKVMWWEGPRLHSHFQPPGIKLCVSLEELAEGNVYSSKVFYQGLELSMLAQWLRKVPVAGGAAALQYTIGVYLAVSSECRLPVRVKFVLLAEAASALDKDLDCHMDTVVATSKGTSNYFRQEVCSAADAKQKLASYIHHDGKLHLKAQIIEVL